MKKIDISTKKYPDTFAIVDDEDYDYLNQWKWYFSKTGYVMRQFWKDGKHKNCTMHRIIMKPPKGMVIDHLNHNSLDNRKCNLRICKNQENVFHQRCFKGSSIYKGVCLDKQRNKWIAYIKRNRLYYLGSFLNEKEAARMYNCAARILHGEYAYENKI